MMRRSGSQPGVLSFVFFFQAEDGIRDYKVTGVQTCALPIYEQGDHGWTLHADGEVERELMVLIAAHALVERGWVARDDPPHLAVETHRDRSEEHTSELQSPCNLVCRLLLEKKKKTNMYYTIV